MMIIAWTTVKAIGLVLGVAFLAAAVMGGDDSKVVQWALKCLTP